MIVWEVWRRIVEFAGERSRPGTAFLLGSGDDQLLTIARHLCTDAPKEVLLLRHPLTNDGFAYRLTEIRVGMDVAPTADFAIFRMTKPIVDVGADVPLTSDGFGFSQAAYILGYPFGLSLRCRRRSRSTRWRHPQGASVSCSSRILYAVPGQPGLRRTHDSIRG